MTDGTCQPVSVSRTIQAPAEKLFGLLAHSANHPLIDGSGMLREALSDVVLSKVGDVFAMRMHNDEMGDYEMSNYVVDYELNRRIGWEPVLAAASRAEDLADIGERAKHRWSYELTPIDSGSTLVVETYDCVRSPEWLRKAVKGGIRWTSSMTATLGEAGRPQPRLTAIRAPGEREAGGYNMPRRAFRNAGSLPTWRATSAG